ncbi:MAG: M6 family metalloprotease domain-containing protein [Candidatus Marinimicrobia bacterium]|nr:M6 family metalloprotease domain-containing protein [Candidatus Neomarinimicrobiota bacterium]
MKKIIPILLTLRFLFAINAVPHLINLRQPDGTVIRAYVKGDEWQHWYETESGYSLVRNEKSEWVFAKDVHEFRLIPSEVRVTPTDLDPNFLGLPVSKHLKPAPRMVKVQSPFPDLSQPRVEDFQVPLLLIDYTDYTFQYPMGNFIEQMNDPGYNGTGSFRDYYEEVSYNQFHPATTVTGWFTADNEHDYYGDNQPEDRAIQLVREAVDAAEDAGFDFSLYDNDGDGYVDALNIIHAGPGAEAGDETSIWSHKWYLSAANLAVQYDGVWIDGYTINPETYDNSQASIGVISHEFGHALGLPDLYDTNGGSAGAGNWALMAGGGWGADGSSPWFPSHMCAWSKIELGWIVPIVLPNDTSGILLPPVETFPVVYQIHHPIDTSEYFLLENRNKRGFDINMYTDGLLIWHIDEEKTSLYPGSNTVNADEPHFGVGLEQADGNFNLENNRGRGDTGDPFPGSTDNHTFDDDTTPNSHSYYLVPSLISVDNITLIDTLIQVDVTIGSGEMIHAGLSGLSGAAWDTNTVTVLLENDFDLSEFECIIVEDPDRMIIIDVRPSERAADMTISFEEMEDGRAHIHLTDGVIPAGTGILFDIDYFAYTGLEDWYHFLMYDGDAFDTSGIEVIVTLDEIDYFLFSPPPKIEVISTTAPAGGIGSIPIFLDNKVGVSLLIFHVQDTPDVLTLYAEPFSDDNNNGQWDEGEEFEDTNGDSIWTDVVTLSDRFSEGWVMNVFETMGRFVVAAQNWDDPLEPDSSILLELNFQVAADAPSGDVVLDYPILLMKTVQQEGYLEPEGISGILTVTGGVGIQEELTGIPEKFTLHQNYPNPFNPITTIQYDLPEASDVRLVIYNLLSREVITLIQDRQEAGYQSVIWNGRDRGGRDVATGIYIYQLVAGDPSSGLGRAFMSTKKLVLIK